MHNIGVLTGDVVGSQRIQDRERLSRTLEDTLALLESSLLHDESQQALAKRLARTQPTINRRLVAARWPLIRDYLDHVGTRLTEGLA